MTGHESCASSPLPLPDLDNYVLQLEISAALGSRKTRRSGQFTKCSECGHRVELLEDQVRILTSSGNGVRWVMRRPETHTRACRDAHNVRMEALLVEHADFDLYEA